MATLTFAAPVDDDLPSQHTEFVATSPTGDKFSIPVASQDKDVVLIFNNGHTSPITVAVVAQPTTMALTGKGSGTWTRPNRDIVIANGETHSMIIRATELKAFIDATNFLNLSYTGGNAALTVLGFLV
ncbi:hypothetical protein AA309_20215 [Microvirga vignae]|uniref:Uncharacterized protein n=1 Tax=Microvirga vignae TaxID=1225564 RepID=A0A0H1RFP4_9HYPH|nr:hypothetical protein [Microvirga vignae]KLK91422.1 hypothetical protein AA309_20215 [Microvirga vignae]